MKSIILFTDKPINYIECQTVLEKIYPNIKMGETYTHYGNPPKSFSIEIELERENTTIEPLDDDLTRRVPIVHPYCTTISFHKEIIAQRVVEAILTLYPELYIYEDQLDWAGTANEYLKLKIGDYNY